MDAERPSPLRAFVLAPSHSGSTLLAILLNSHPDIVDLGDTNPPDEREECSCGQSVGACDYWQDLARHLGLEHSPRSSKWMPRLPAYTGVAMIDRTIAIGSALLGPFEWSLDRRVSRKAADYVEMQRALAEHVTERAGARVFVDGEKSITKAAYLSGVNSEPTVLIHLVRDPRGTVWSTVSRGHDSVRGAAWRWRVYHEAATLTRHLIPRDRSVLIRYEDLATDPATTLAPVMRLLGVAPSSPDETALPLGKQHVIGNRMVGGVRVAVNLDESWRDELPASDAALVLRIAGRLGRRYGYA